MDGTDSIGALGASTSAAALNQLQQITLQQRTAGVTTEDVVGSSDAQKQQLVSRCVSLRHPWLDNVYLEGQRAHSAHFPQRQKLLLVAYLVPARRSSIPATGLTPQ